MSYTELHYGKLMPLASGMSLESLKDWLSVEGRENLEIEDFEDKVGDGLQYFEINDKTKRYKEAFYMPYIYYKTTLYKVVEHSGVQETDYLDITKQNEDGTVDFTYMFYNGGTCFSEMLEEGLNKVHK
jgi:hypothetical protein